MTNLERDKQPITQSDKRMFRQKDKLAGEKKERLQAIYKYLYII